MGNGALVSKITQTHPGVYPTMLVGLSRSNNELKETQLRRTNCQPIHRRRFEIEGEAFIVTLHDEEEPKNIKRLSIVLLKKNGRK